MELKKTPRADLQNRRVLFIEIGLIIALGAVVLAFDWGQSEKTVAQITDVAAVVEQEVVINTEQPERPPEVKPQVNQVFSDFLEVVTDNEIATDYSFDEFDEDFVVEVPTVVEEVVEDMPMMTVTDMPQFQGGGLPEFRKWVQTEMRYPRMAMENNIQGTVTLKFVIERDGSLSNIEVLTSPDRSLVDEAVRVLKTSPKWTPGRHNGRPARVFYILPVVFELQN